MPQTGEKALDLMVTNALHPCQYFYPLPYLCRSEYVYTFSQLKGGTIKTEETTLQTSHTATSDFTGAEPVH